MINKYDLNEGQLKYLELVKKVSKNILDGSITPKELLEVFIDFNSSIYMDEDVYDKYKSDVILLSDMLEEGELTNYNFKWIMLQYVDDILEIKDINEEEHCCTCNSFSTDNLIDEEIIKKSTFVYNDIISAYSSFIKEWDSGDLEDNAKLMITIKKIPNNKLHVSIKQEEGENNLERIKDIYSGFRVDEDIDREDINKAIRKHLKKSRFPYYYPRKKNSPFPFFDIT